jgi:hypothetical protein
MTLAVDSSGSVSTAVGAAESGRGSSQDRLFPAFGIDPGESGGARGVRNHTSAAASPVREPSIAGDGARCAGVGNARWLLSPGLTAPDAVPGDRPENKSTKRSRR